ncbi:unnamed protein product [Rotaria sordida]|uniref:Uncharacterized protein n=1 Tax=Rotaria sordida TaxID=392033 RepID=A0A814CGF4_9BILA|nr:unnamed protein product [Rotaria sordida]CAF0970526.1 unnamed protein product [Rotaria sordida]
MPSYNRQLCPLITTTNNTATTIVPTTTTTDAPQIAVIPNIPANARWVQNGVTVAGGNGQGSATNQLDRAYGLCVDDD